MAHIKMADVETLDSRILLVEDNIINQKVALGMLKKFGLIADIAENGQEAVNLLLEKQYDLVFMDCQMPILDGYSATREIRKNEAGQSYTPIVAMTANAMQGDAEKCLASGMDGYLAKPVKVDLLHETLKKWLDDSIEPINFKPSA